ncbi:putative ornithine cyclodeaminase [Agrobacterium fabrum]|uniref:Putative ornithine cyclodeaminase n=1 Tax=Agrobacterium fabrum (strain C58 / ATCC 33970) TaxID=176299 RepID=K0PUV4_AGRFC|nr:putative ornithine cyclodeaminase [Agrobacterium fabrum]CAD0213206.1 Alanine dehydrogenase [Agrobacterium tumefaciens]DAA35266.1 TPA_exp: putative ornithine cyclodeaminase [Agrobacterium fabrum str. C58]
MLHILAIPTPQRILGGISQLANGRVKPLAQPDIKLNRSKSVCVGIHELPPGGPSFRPHPRFAIEICGSAEEAVEGADIITTVTADKQYATILTDNMVGPGIHINAVGGDCPGKTELHRDILLRSDIFVEYPPQTRIEGEIQQLPADYPVTELWQVISGEKQGRAGDRQITLFDSVGFATEDFSALRYVRSKLAATGLYTELDLLADPDEPRDLFGMLLRCEAALVQTGDRQQA